MIALIDYKAGNLTSVRKALAAVEAPVFTPETPEQLAAIAREAHSFGGSAAMLGFSEMAGACRALQSASLDEAGGALHSCRIARDRALAELDKISADLSEAAVA